ALAGARPLQACVFWDGPLADDAALFAGLRTTPLLVTVAGKERSLPAFRKALEAAGIHHRIRLYEDVSPGFMTPQPGKQHAHTETEQAWVEVYNFLGKYVEDA